MHKQPLIKKLLRYTRNLLIFFFASTLLAVIIYRFMPVYVTPLMVIRSVQQVFSGDKPTWKHTWVSFDKISPSLPETGSKHHQSADSQECILMAAIFVGTQRARSLFYVSHRTLLVERANYGSLSQLYRNGKWHLRCTSNRKK